MSYPPRGRASKNLDKLIKIRRFHEYYSHPSINETKRMAELWFKDNGITHSDIDDWHDKKGKFCAGCLEGEHARSSSTKPLTANRPGENKVADVQDLATQVVSAGRLPNRRSASRSDRIT